MLFQLGALQFDVFPFNAHETEREASADFAAKDVLGAMRPREAVGEGDETFRLVGRVFPQALGGLEAFDVLDGMRTSQSPQILVRGDGLNLGWWLVERVHERSTALAGNGVGRVIDYEITLVKTPSRPSAAGYIASLLRILA